MGQPLVIDDTVYAVATPVYMGSEMSLVAVSLSNGNLKWKMPLGSLGSGMNYRGTTAMSKPVMLRAADRIYVLTGCGALVAVDLPGKRVEWVFTFETQPLQAARISGIYRKSEAQEFSSSLRLEGGVLYVKEKGGNVLYAVDTAGPGVRWQRRVDRDTTIAGVDASSLYLLGEELCAIDLSTREMRWSARTPLGPRQFTPWVEGSRAYVFGASGVYGVDLRAGASQTFMGYDKGGGAVFRLNDRVICVSNRSVTAYPVPKAEGGER
jgi:outer membrane protein assembly factor BamB